MIYVQWPGSLVSTLAQSPVSCDLLLSVTGCHNVSLSTIQRLQVPAELHELLLLALLPAGAAPQPGPLLHPGLLPRPRPAAAAAHAPGEDNF